MIDEMREEITALEAERDALQAERNAFYSVVKEAHGALADARSVPVPGELTALLGPSIRHLAAERDALKAENWHLAHEKQSAEQERDALRAEVEELRKQVRDYRDAASAEALLADEARAEVDRLKRGDFTPEEFQNLCHHRDEKPGCTVTDFMAGCNEYIRKLFGDQAALLAKRPGGGVMSQNWYMVCPQCKAKAIAYRFVGLGSPNPPNGDKVHNFFWRHWQCAGFLPSEYESGPVLNDDDFFTSLTEWETYGDGDEATPKKRPGE